MMDIELRRRFFAEELEAVCKLRTPALVDAFATVPRDQFLPPGPWTVLADSDLSFTIGSGPQRLRATPDADPARVYHNIAVAIDPERQLFNGSRARWASGSIRSSSPRARVSSTSAPAWVTARR